MRQILTSLFTLFYLFGTAQSLVQKTTKMMVISPKGINIYAKPDIHSEKIGSLPFGAKIELHFNWEAEKDTIGSHKYWTHYYAHDIFIIGRWQQLSGPLQKGYVFDAYLGGLYDTYPPFRNTKLNQSHIILFPGSNCANNFQYNPNMNWFGFYKIDNQFIIKPVDLIFFNTADRMNNKNICAVDYKHLKFIYGTESDLNSVTPNNGKFIDENISTNFDNYSELSQTAKGLFIRRDGKTQILNKEYGGLGIVRWQGDLDSDGKNDYIIHFGEVGAFYMLFLSSEAKKNEILGAVAFFMTPYCC